MYYLLKGKTNLKFFALKLKEYVTTQELSETDKLNLARHLVLEQFSGYVNKTAGSFIGIKELKVIKITTGGLNYDYCDLELQVQLYFYKVKVKQIVDFKVTKIHPHYVQGTCFSYVVQVPLDHLSTITPVYNSALNYVQVGQKRIKEQDELRIRVTSIQNPKNILFEKYKIKGTCRNTGAGKLSR